MEEILRAVCPRSVACCGGEEGLAVSSDDAPEQAVLSKQLEQTTLVVRALKNALVGNDTAKAAALRLGVEEELLAFLDVAASAGSGAYEPALLQGMGLVSILTYSLSAQAGLIAGSARLVGHLQRALDFRSEKTVATSLRALGSLYSRHGPQDNQSTARAGEAAAGNSSATFLPMKDVAAKVLMEVARGQLWSPGLRMLGAEALAALTIDVELARALVPAAVSSGTALLGPIAPARPPSADPTETKRTNGAPAVLRFVFNLSSAEPKAVFDWLTSCAPGWSPWGALKGLEVELSSRDEEVRILAGLILIKCLEGRHMGGTGAGAARSRAPSTPPHPNNRAAQKPGAPSSNDPRRGNAPQALDAVVAHRVLPLFVRTLRSWSAIPLYASFWTSGDSLAAVCGDHAEALAGAMATAMELGSRERQNEAVAYGAVDALAGFLGRVRLEATATAEKGDGNRRGIPAPSSSKQSGTGYRNTGLLSGAARATLQALATLCARCETAQERVVTLGFHSVVAFWLAGAGGGGAVLLAALSLIRNLGRSSVSCAALVGVRAYESLIDLLLAAGDQEGVKVEGAGELEARAAEGLANMALEHEVVKETIVGSECLRWVFKAAVDASADIKVRGACIALLKSTCFLAPAYVRVEVTYILGGVDGMLGLIQGPRDGLFVLQGLQALRNLLHAVPLWTLCRVDREATDETGVATDGGPEARTDDQGERQAGVVAGVASVAAAAAAAPPPQRDAGHTVPRNVPPADGRRSWQGWRSRNEQGPLERNYGRMLWGGVRAPDPRRMLIGGSVLPVGPSPMDVEFQPSGHFYGCPMDRGTGRWVAGRAARAGGQDGGSWGLSRLIEAILCTLEGAPTGEGCDETSCAALRLLHTLSSADASQRAALRTPRVLHVILPHLMADSGHDHHILRNTTAPAENASDCWRANPATWDPRRGGASSFACPAHGVMATSPPPWACAATVAQLLHAQLFPDRPGDAAGINAGVASADAATAAVVAACGFGGWGGRASAARSWCSGLEFDAASGAGRRGGE